MTQFFITVVVAIYGRCLYRTMNNSTRFVDHLNRLGQSWKATMDSKLNMYWQWSYAASLIYSPAVCLTKFTLLLLIARVFEVNGCISKGIYAFICFIAVVYIPVEILKICICTPISFYWDISLKGGMCMSQTPIFVIDTMLALALDV